MRNDRFPLLINHCQCSVESVINNTKMDFSLEELTDMLWVLGECSRNCLLATRVYHQRFPERRPPPKTSFEKLMERFNRTGSVKYESHEKPKTITTEDMELSVLLTTYDDPHLGTRDIARRQSISRRSVQRILHKYKMHPYHIQLHQELINNDYQRRVAFCEWALQKIRTTTCFSDTILFGDEATFHRNGTVNRHNFHFYATSNPYIFSTHSQTRWSLNVWGGIVGNHVVGPHFFEGTVNGTVYLDFLQNHLPILLEDVPLSVRNNMWFLHDGAPVHHTGPIQNYLNEKFPDRWIGRGGPIAWPARSPDLTKIDFFLWGHVKNLVYASQPSTREEMKNKIIETFRNIDVDMLRRVTRSFEDRLQTCIDVSGSIFEHLL